MTTTTSVIEEVQNEPRSNGVTIMFKRQVMVTQEPIKEDQDLINQTMGLHEQWIKDGKPESNQGW